MNKPDPMSDKLERLSKKVDSMQVGEIILPTQLFKPIQIHVDTGNGWYKMATTLKEIPLIPLFDGDEIRAYQKVDEDSDTLASIKKTLIEIKREIRELKNAK